MTRQLKRIIIEGMDGSGKTHLIDYLMMHVPNLEVIVNEKGPEQDFNHWWPDQLDRPVDILVPLHDRFFYSELVYGPLLRGHINAQPVLVQNGLWFLRSTALLIYCRPDSEKLREGVQVEQQMEGVTDKFNELLKLYDELMDAEKRWYGPRFIHYVWHRENEFNRVEQLVKEYLAHD